jgi:hypothetical protein
MTTAIGTDLVYQGPIGEAAWTGDRCKVVEEIPAMSWGGNPTNGEPGSIKYLYDALLVENLQDDTRFIAPKSWFKESAKATTKPASGYVRKIAGI